MFEIKLLKLKKGIGKNGKEYYQASILVGNEILNTFILKYQYEAILSSLSEYEVILSSLSDEENEKE